MRDMILPWWVKKILEKPTHISDYSNVEINELKQKLRRFQSKNPLVTIVMPALNEEKTILHTLISLAESTATFPAELIVVDNNSADGTGALLHRLGVRTLLETRHGTGHARAKGLFNARGKYILTGDGHTLYPPEWVADMTYAMVYDEKAKIYCVTGGYSYLSAKKSLSLRSTLYKLISSVIITRTKKCPPYFMTEGFNCGFVKEKCIDIDGCYFEMQNPCKTNGDSENIIMQGMMTLRLNRSGGRIKNMKTKGTRVWTYDRRRQPDSYQRKGNENYY